MTDEREAGSRKWEVDVSRSCKASIGLTGGISPEKPTDGGGNPTGVALFGDAECSMSMPKDR